MKAIKILVKTVVVIGVLIVVALLALPLWFGPVAKASANIAVPKVTLTGFHLGHIHLNPYTARFELRDVQLSNPEGYSEEFAATLGDLTFDAETFSLATDVIHIEEITVKDVFVSVVGGGANDVMNFKQIQYNVAGGKEKYEAAEAEKQAAEEAKAEKLRLQEMQTSAAEGEEKNVADEPETTDKPAKKIIIDKLHISGLKVKIGIIPISIPATVELTDIGRVSGGATFKEAWQQIWEGILKAAGIAGDQLKAIGDMTGEAARQAAAAANEVARQATDATSEVARQATDAANKAASAVTDTTSKATESATKAVEGATKALDSLKELW